MVYYFLLFHTQILPVNKCLCTFPVNLFTFPYTNITGNLMFVYFSVDVFTVPCKDITHELFVLNFSDE